MGEVRYYPPLLFLTHSTDWSTIGAITLPCSYGASTALPRKSPATLHCCVLKIR
jgi:hypothetical protein